MSFITEIKAELAQNLQKKIKSAPTNKKSKNDAETVSGVFLQRAQGGIALRGRNLPVGERNAFGSGYHIDFVFENVAEARDFCDILAVYDILPKLTTRKNAFVVYLKHSDDICNLLALMGAGDCLLQLHDEIALRDVRNRANRRANCDTANIEKQVAAARRQVEAIETLRANGTLATLDERLRAVATARLENPEATYEEIANTLGITKSGVVHRIERLLDL